MTQSQFNPEACHEAVRKKIGPIYGGPEGDGTLDPRLLYYLELVAKAGELSPGKHLVDLGAGLSAFGPVAAVLGMKVTLIDDFGGGGGVEMEEKDKATKILDGFRSQLGIHIIELDIVSKPLPLETASVDVFTCFHSLEHWHCSPKPLFQEISRALKPGGHLILATPNAVNLRKRFFVLLGRSNFPPLDYWYYEGDPVYRGHVREPTVRDLQQLLEWNNFDVIATEGRNYIGRNSRSLPFLPQGFVNAVADAVDCVIRFFPTLCSDIHVIGRKRS